jgi:hypothetical protein
MYTVTDRTHSCATAWPTALDELDVGQSFPYPLEMFEAGVGLLIASFKLRFYIDFYALIL